MEPHVAKDVGRGQLSIQDEYVDVVRIDHLEDRDGDDKGEDEIIGDGPTAHRCIDSIGNQHRINSARGLQTFPRHQPGPRSGLRDWCKRVNQGIFCAMVLAEQS